MYDKRNGLGFITVNFPFLCSNIPAKPAYGAYISQLVCTYISIGGISTIFVPFERSQYKLKQSSLVRGFGTRDCVRRSGSL